MSSKYKFVIWSCDTGQQTPCFDRCFLNITWMLNIKDVYCKPAPPRLLKLHFTLIYMKGTYGSTYAQTVMGPQVFRLMAYQIFLRCGTPLVCLQCPGDPL